MNGECPLKPGTQYTRSTVDFVAGLPKVDCCWLVQICRLCCKLEHVQLGRLCQKLVVFVARMSDVLSTVSPVCAGPKRHNKVDCVEFDFVANVYWALFGLLWQTVTMLTSLMTRVLESFYTRPAVCIDV